jgi:Protein of unknown function (DUF3616)
MNLHLLCIQCLVGLLVSVAAVGQQVAYAQAPITIYRLLCDASAAVALDADHFVVANDERNQLQLYKRGTAHPVKSVDLSSFLGTQPKKESDLEGAAALGQRIYWLSSHGRNKDAEHQERRHRFFATDVQTGSGGVTIVPVGSEAYTALQADMLAAPQLRPYKLAEAEKLAPEAVGGFNIEGLAATTDDKLLIGFRNPIRSQKALVVPLENPAAVIKGEKAQFGTPIELDLGDRGIRSIELVGSSYVIVAGPPGKTGTFKLYRWSGKADNTPNEIQGIDLQGLRPEALFVVPQTNTIQILSDDGDEQVDGLDCKDQNEEKQSFRSIIITP